MLKMNVLIKLMEIDEQDIIQKDIQNGVVENPSFYIDVYSAQTGSLI